MKRNIYKYAATGLSAIILSAGISGTAFSAQPKNINSNPQVTDTAKPACGFDKLKKKIDKLAKEGVIPQATADKIADYLNKKAEKSPESKNKAKSNEKKPKLLEELVSAGIITQKEADAIKTTVKQAETNDKSGEESEDKGKFSLQSLVEKGTISQATADKIGAYVQNKEAERKAHFLDKSGKLLDEMVAEGVLTQKEANTIKDALCKPSSR